ncbi:MAG: hypothetical protein WEA10_10330 [Actinomycetota bacterium]
MTQAPTAFGLTGYHHVQLAMPPGREDDAEAFYVRNPFGNRIELIEERG